MLDDIFKAIGHGHEKHGWDRHHGDKGHHGHGSHHGQHGRRRSRLGDLFGGFRNDD